MSFVGHIKRQKISLAVSLVVLALVLGSNIFSFTSQPFASVEVKIAEHSPIGTMGGAVVPASCPSFAHSFTGICPACGPNQIFGQTSQTSCNGDSCSGVSVDICVDCPAGQTSNADHTACVAACAANQGQACSASNSCGTNNGTIQCSGACSVSAPSCTPPTVYICAGSGCTPSTSSVTTTPGSQVTVSWSCPSPNTSSSNNFNSSTAASGSATLTVNTTTTYTVQCQSGASGGATANIVNPNISLSASPSRVRSGTSSTLSWYALSVQSCTLSGPGVFVPATADASGNVGSSGTPRQTSTGVITGRSVYTLVCQTVGNPVSASVTVSLIPVQIEI
jgi:hypothetical protein